MSNDYFAWRLAQEHQREILKEAETNRLLQEAEVNDSQSLKRRLFVALCIAVGLAALIAQVVVAAATARGG